MIDLFLGFSAITLGFIAIPTTLVIIHLLVFSDTGPAFLALVFWGFVAYYIGAAILGAL